MKAGYVKVGITSSGRDFFMSFFEDIETQIEQIIFDFNHEEIFDAYAMTQAILLKEFRRNPLQEHIGLLDMFSRRLKDYLTNADVFEQMANSKKINTSIDIVNYATPLLLHALRESIY